MKQQIDTIAQALTTRLQRIDYDSLPISDYNKRYIGNLKPVLDYYLQIYANCIAKGLAHTGLAPEEVTMVDFGGGSGFLSMLAKQVGIGQVIYVDLNPASVETIRVLKQQTGMGPDLILQGDSTTFSAWCAQTATRPHLFIATDLIEHIYDIEDFLYDLTEINRQMYTILTTASTPFNPFVKRRLHKLMDGCEKGNLVTPNYLTQRYQYILKNYPDFTHKVAIDWSKRTRGLTFTDLDLHIASNWLARPSDPHNTCDPATGNCTERILPISVYASFLPSSYTLTIEKGFYNTNRNNRLLALLCKQLNRLIASTDKIGFTLAPFIILSFGKQGKKSGTDIGASHLFGA